MKRQLSPEALIKLIQKASGGPTRSLIYTLATTTDERGETALSYLYTAKVPDIKNNQAKELIKAITDKTLEICRKEEEEAEEKENATPELREAKLKKNLNASKTYEEAKRALDVYRRANERAEKRRQKIQGSPLPETIPCPTELIIKHCHTNRKLVLQYIKHSALEAKGRYEARYLTRNLYQYVADLNLPTVKDYHETLCFYFSEFIKLGIQPKKQINFYVTIGRAAKTLRQLFLPKDQRETFRKALPTLFVLYNSENQVETAIYANNLVLAELLLSLPGISEYIFTRCPYSNPLLAAQKQLVKTGNPGWSNIIERLIALKADANAPVNYTIRYNNTPNYLGRLPSISTILHELGHQQPGEAPQEKIRGLSIPREEIRIAAAPGLKNSKRARDVHQEKEKRKRAKSGFFNNPLTNLPPLSGQASASTLK